MTDKRLPILLLTGYLGSGKTTLVNHILNNRKGIKFAVIVNDIGEVNIDASLIEKGGVVGKKDESLVALQNGCICCSLKMDLVEQILDIAKTGKFDYIVIEASGICEPVPIAQTINSIPYMDEKYMRYGVPYLDCICSVVDALRLRDEFAGGDALQRKDIEEEDIENLIIQQIEFCNIILLNKASEVSVDELARIRKVIRAIQPEAQIIECDYADVDINRLLNTGLFNFDQLAGSATWVKELERPADEIEEENRHHDHHDHEHCDCHGHHHDHGHCHHHHHDHCHGSHEEEEYGIGSFVYLRRPAFDLNKFDRFVNTQWPKNVIRTKGVVWFSVNPDMSYLFEQAGRQMKLTEAGKWFATAPEEELRQFMSNEPGLLRDWDDKYGDRMQKIVFIGRNLDREAITAALDKCLAE